MFQLSKRTGNAFAYGSEVLGSFDTFEEALRVGQEKICADLCHEGGVRTVGHSYWFSDESDADIAYRGKITRIS